MKLRILGVTFAYGSTRVLEGVSFDVAAGRLVGVIGPNGAGKSTLLRCMHAALQPSDGSVLVDGEDLSTLPRRDVATRVAVVPQACAPGFRVSVEQFVGMGRFAHESFLGVASERDRDVVRQALIDVDVEAFAERSVLELSGGEFRRVLIAQALAQGAPVMLFDEPVQQLDLRHQIEVMEIVQRVARRADSAAVAVLHDLTLAARYCDELVLLARGRVAAAGAPVDVVTHELLRDVYGIEASIERCATTGALRAIPIRAIATERRACVDNGFQRQGDTAS